MNSIKVALQRELKDAGWHSRGYLPHFDAGEIAQTITFRLADSLPHIVLERWKRELERESAPNPCFVSALNIIWIKVMAVVL